MDLQLAGNVAVVIGGANGIGRAIAAGFAEEGAHVAIVDRDPQSAHVASQMPTALGSSCRGWTADAADDGQLRQISQQIIELWGHCDHLVFAVGAGSGKYGFPFWNLSPSDWPRVLRINLEAAVAAAHVFAPLFTAQRRGSIVFISSIAGQIGSQTDPPYSAAKAGLINFAQCAAKDLAPYDVRVNTICPGMIKTQLNQSVWRAWHDQQPEGERQSYEEWAGEKVRRVAPLGRWQDPEDVAALAVFLASPRARNITGQTMNVDGGQVMHW